jgi:hypothetical protein
MPPTFAICHAYGSHFFEVIFTAAQATPASTQDNSSQVRLRTAVAQVAKENISTVVHIKTKQQKEVVNPFFPFENDSFFRYCFDDHRELRKIE